MIEAIVGWTATFFAVFGVGLGVWLIFLTLRQSRRNNLAIQVVSDRVEGGISEAQELTKHLIDQVESLDPALTAKAAEALLETAKNAAIDVLATADKIAHEKKDT